MSEERVDPVEQDLRTAFAVGLIHSGWYDGDEHDAADLIQWHPCNDHGACRGFSCKGCAGRPYTSDLIWSKVDTFGHLTAALNRVRADERAKVAEEIARALEVKRGDRCPSCGGWHASKKWLGNPSRTAWRCGCGNTWERRHSAMPYYDEAAIAREHGRTI